MDAPPLEHDPGSRRLQDKDHAAQETVPAWNRAIDYSRESIDINSQKIATPQYGRACELQRKGRWHPTLGHRPK